MNSITYYVLKGLSRWLKKSSRTGQLRYQSLLAAFLYRHVSLRKDRAYSQLKNAFPTRTEGSLRKTMQQLYLHFTGEFLRFLTLPESFRTLTFTVEGIRHLQQALGGGRGVLLVTGHFGSWETLAAWLGQAGYPVTAVANRQSNRGADRFFREQRETSGIEHIYNKRGTAAMKSVLDQNRILILASDQDARRNGVFVRFFGRPASTPRGAAVFHRRTGAPILFATCQAEGPRAFRVRFQPLPIGRQASVPDIVQAYTSCLEAAIRPHPEQYFWFHRRWKTKPPRSA
ncbi:MAG: hypothetical protein D6762_05865 [Candidatus Neomarinimicrobiota bacterium]|nr:MAG: hypothetical protein D6762_05865 [Candidatus Neomarinimicrobiota bacterium]